MPFLELRVSGGGLSPQQTDVLACSLTDAFLIGLGCRPDNQTARSLVRVEVTTDGPVYVHGRAAEAPLYRLRYWVPAGAMNEAARTELVGASTTAVLAMGGAETTTDEAARVWCMVLDVPDGGWSSGGDAYAWPDIKRYVARGEVRRRQAARVGSAR